MTDRSMLYLARKRVVPLMPRVHIPSDDELMVMEGWPKWHECITAYSNGQAVQYRNTGCNERPTGAWYDLTDGMVEGKGFWACQTGAFGPCWDWTWMEYRIKPEVQ